ncbi:hypothetical protein M0804_008429 [Polistes exclamans]|nr:hypothetical protein M0804_008429 [Polistes exclamans]
MIPRILVALLIILGHILNESFALTLPEITSYAKVSRNGEETKSTGNGPFSWITRALVRGNNSGIVENEGRNAKDIVITMSPVYVPSRISKLKNGEVIDHPSTKRYSTIDEELLAKLDSTKSKSKIQDRFHPPASFEHNVKQQIVSSGPTPMSSMSADTNPNIPSSSSISGYSRPIYAGPYSIKTNDYNKPKDYLMDKPISKPIGINNYPSIVTDDKPMDLFPNHQNDDTNFPNFSSEPSYDDHAAPKPIEFDRPTSFDDNDDNNDDDNDDTYPRDHDHYHDHHQEIIYDHIPDYHNYHHHHHYTTTPEPEMNDQRLDKRPYSYYFIGKKLWYIPLYFSIYFIVYIAALVLKSIARHKITFPSHLAEVAGHGRMNNYESFDWWDLTNRVFNGIEDFSDRFGKGS